MLLPHCLVPHHPMSGTPSKCQECHSLSGTQPPCQEPHPHVRTPIPCLEPHPHVRNPTPCLKPHPHVRNPTPCQEPHLHVRNPIPDWNPFPMSGIAPSVPPPHHLVPTPAPSPTLSNIITKGPLHLKRKFGFFQVFHPHPHVWNPIPMSGTLPLVWNPIPMSGIPSAVPPLHHFAPPYICNQN